MSDAANVMVYVGIPRDGNCQRHIEEALRAVEEAGCDATQMKRVREKGAKVGAVWHIFHAQDADKIRELLKQVTVRKQPSIHDIALTRSWQHKPLVLLIYFSIEKRINFQDPAKRL